MDDASVIRQDYAVPDDVKHPKRSVFVWLTMSLAATDFWKEANKITCNPDWGVSANPFEKTNSDVILAEALMFFWQSFICHVVQKKQQQQLTETDFQAVSDAAALMMLIIEHQTPWSMFDIFHARNCEYITKADNSIKIFCRVILRSLGKQAINDPDRPLDLGKDDHMSIWAWTMTYMKQKLPEYFELYEHTVQRFPMD
jgi:hypothetical protein